MSVMKKVAANYIFQMAGKALSLLIGLVVVAILTRYLSEEDWGAYVTATTFLSFFGVFVDFGLTLTLTQMISTSGADEKKVVGSIMGIRLTSGAVFYTLSTLVVWLLPYSNTAKAAVAAGAAAFFFLSASASMVGLFQKHLALKRYVLAETISRGFYLLFTFLCVYFGFGLLPILGAMGLANAIWFASIFIAAKPLVVIRPQFNWPIWKEAFYKSSPIAISTIFNLMYLRGDVLILAWAKPEDVPQYGTAYKVVDVLTAFPTMFMGLLLPQLTLAWTGKNFENFKNILQRAFDLFAIVVIPLFFGTQLVGPQLTALIAGDRYLTAGLILKILIVAIICVFISTLYGHTIVALHKQKIMTWGYALTAIISIVGYFIFIPRFGMWGAAWVTCLSELLIAALTFGAVSWFSKTWPKLSVAVRALISSIGMFSFLWIMPSLPVLLTVIIGAVIYLLLMLGLGGIKINELKSLLPRNHQT